MPQRVDPLQIRIVLGLSTVGYNLHMDRPTDETAQTPHPDVSWLSSPLTYELTRRAWVALARSHGPSATPELRRERAAIHDLLYRKTPP